MRCHHDVGMPDRSIFSLLFKFDNPLIPCKRSMKSKVYADTFVCSSGYLPQAGGKKSPRCFCLEKSLGSLVLCHTTSVTCLSDCYMLCGIISCYFCFPVKTTTTKNTCSLKGVPAVKADKSQLFTGA